WLPARTFAQPDYWRHPADVAPALSPVGPVDAPRLVLRQRDRGLARHVHVRDHDEVLLRNRFEAESHASSTRAHQAPAVCDSTLADDRAAGHGCGLDLAVPEDRSERQGRSGDRQYRVGVDAAARARGDYEIRAGDRLEGRRLSAGSSAAPAA